MLVLLILLAYATSGSSAPISNGPTKITCVPAHRDEVHGALLLENYSEPSIWKWWLCQYRIICGVFGRSG